jgi:hypothetical protein
MILFHNIVEIFHLANDDRQAVLLIVAANGCGIGLTAINRDLLRYAMAADSLSEEPSGSPFVALLGEEKIDGLAGLIDRAIEIAPLALDLDVRLVHPPTAPHRALPPVKRLFQQAAVFHDPTLNGGVINGYPAFLQEFFDMAIAQRVG